MTERTFSLTDRKVEVGDLLIHVNQAGSGPPCVVLHHSTGPFWSAFHDRLAESFTVVSPDMPGFGQSTRPDDARHPAHLAVLLNQLLDTEGLDQVHLLGFGLGGWIAAEMATMHQGRLLTLTLVGAAGILPRQGYIHDPMTESWTDYARLGFRDDEHFVAVFGEEPIEQVTQLWDYSREMTARITWKPWMWSLPLPTLLRGVRTPTLVVWGEQDRVVPLDCGHQYAEALPNATLEIVPDAGHVVELEEPERLAGLLASRAGV
jgi:pimeloyl-ACP methyl ester carboxylesterase